MSAEGGRWHPGSQPRPQEPRGLGWLALSLPGPSREGGGGVLPAGKSSAGLLPAPHPSAPPPTGTHAGVGPLHGARVSLTATETPRAVATQHSLTCPHTCFSDTVSGTNLANAFSMCTNT